MKSLIAVAAVVLATLVILGYLAFIWWLDRYEREPIWLVGATFLWGAVGGTSLGCLLSLPFVGTVTAVAGAEAGQTIGAVVVAPFAEELTKGLIFIPLVLTKHFDNETDGLIYGAAAGLGFAAVENIMYYMGTEGMASLFMVIMMRTLFSSLVHCISSAVLGMAIGYARHRTGTSRWLIYPLIGYALAVVNHGVWNGMATMASFGGAGGGAFFLVGMGLVVGASIVMFLITQYSLKREHEVIRCYLVQEAERGTLPESHADIIPYWRKRRKKGWVPSHVPHEEYVRTATLLAFRHFQMEISPDEKNPGYMEDIRRYRSKIRGWFHS